MDEQKRAELRKKANKIVNCHRSQMYVMSDQERDAAAKDLVATFTTEQLAAILADCLHSLHLEFD